MFRPYKGSYKHQFEIISRLEAVVVALRSDVSDLSEKVQAHGTTLNATHSLAQDSMDSSNHARSSLQELNQKMQRMEVEMEKIPHISLDLAGLKADQEKKFDALDKGFDALNKRFDALETGILKEILRCIS
ncbi:hypothetical protein BDR04DRAFT_1162937 [Suillus decipiens]|nr:hypothetical protein BDR04DRAFT_1162937 [Suillus decipiens]